MHKILKASVFKLVFIAVSAIITMTLETFNAKLYFPIQ